jgi:hypothetical protein
MIEFVDDRKQLKIVVTARAKKVVEEFSDKFDMTEIGVASRLYQWFGALPLAVQKWIVGLTDAGEGEGMRTFADRLLAAAEGPAKLKSIPRGERPESAPDTPELPPDSEQARDGKGKGRGKSR